MAVYAETDVGRERRGKVGQVGNSERGKCLVEIKLKKFFNAIDSNVTGAQLACMLETYVKAVNDPSAVPVMETSWQTSLRMLVERFHNEALELYKKGMTAVLQERGPEPMEAGGTVKSRN